MVTKRRVGEKGVGGGGSETKETGEIYNEKKQERKA